MPDFAQRMVGDIPERDIVETTAETIAITSSIAAVNLED